MAYWFWKSLTFFAKHRAIDTSRFVLFYLSDASVKEWVALKQFLLKSIFKSVIH